MKIKDALHLDLPPDTRFWHRAVFRAARPVLSHALALHELQRVYAAARGSVDGSFAARVLRAMDVQVDVALTNTCIPSSGPLLVVANHPHGLIDGLLLAEIVGRARTDVRIVANWMLGVVPELRELCFFVDPFERSRHPLRSRGGLRAAMNWLRQGHAVVMFPAGAVAPARDPLAKVAVDAPWHPTAARMALATNATVLPACIEGQNSAVFYRAGRAHPLLRTLLLSREFLKLRGRRITVRLDTPVRPASGDCEAVRRTTTASLRQRVDALGTGAAVGASSPPLAVAAAVDADVLAGEIQALSADTRLLTSGDFAVYSVDAARIPNVLNEIGRLREQTFRAVGEGTGNSTDLDRFDGHYLHLFVWNHVRREIAGAYRVGPTDTIVTQRGVDGLYTSTLFRFDERLLAQLSPALELGRSFVRTEYQRNSNALLLLWKGIGRLIVRNPRYRVLFGPVSISRRYADASQQLLMQFLRQNHHDIRLSELVSPRRPPARTPLPAELAAQPLEDSAAVNALVARIEADGSGMPVLLRQYLRLNARLLGFNVDPQFGNALDALMAVDLARVEPAILRRYLGPDGAALFVAAGQRAAA